MCSTLCSSLLGVLFAFNNLLVIIGDNVNATIPEINTAPARVSANSLKSVPVIPPINAIGEYTAINAIVMEITGTAISRVPIIAALNGVSPNFIWRSTFSKTTIASSTTRPIARINANKVIKLIEKSNAWRSKITPIREIGIVITGIKMARNEPINMVITTNTIIVASTMVFTTSWIELLIAIVRSYKISDCMASGRLFLMLSYNGRTFSATVNGFAEEVGLIANTTESEPFATARELSLDLFNSTSAISRKRTSLSPLDATIRLPNSSTDFVVVSTLFL